MTNALSEIEQPKRQLSEVERVALAIAKGGLFGSNDPNAILTLCYLAQAEGQHPAVVFRDYHIIQGKPAKKADAMLRDFINAGGKVEWHSLSDECADATFTHPAGAARIEWTMKRAQAAGLSTPMWKKYPRQMLRSRVISEGIRTVYPGATSGLYEENEVHDIVAQSPKPAPQLAAVSDDPVEQFGTEPEAPTEKHDARKNPWSEFYSGRSQLHKGLVTHEAELARLGVEGTFDDLEAYLTSPEYSDFIKVAGEHMPHYLEGGEPAPPEFQGIFASEQKARDMIAIRGNIAAEAA